MPRYVAIAALALSISLPAPASAGAVGRACLISGRSAANPALCRCIDGVARATLSFAWQNQAAALMRRPSMAERIMRSRQKVHKAFWNDYSNFAKAAEKQCG